MKDDGSTHMCYDSDSNVVCLVLARDGRILSPNPGSESVRSRGGRWRRPASLREHGGQT